MRISDWSSDVCSSDLAAGGVVISIPGNAPFCLSCVSRHWEDETLPQPAVDPTGTVLPIGCNQPTFTGGGFDLQEVSRSEERRVGKACVRTGVSRWSQHH